MTAAKMKRKRLSELIDEVLGRHIDVTQFMRSYCDAEDMTSDDAYESENESLYFGHILQILAWVSTEDITKPEREYGYITSEEFLTWLANIQRDYKAGKDMKDVYVP